MVNEKRQRHCFAPGCTAGYVSARKQGKKASLFTAPEDDERRKAWERLIPRADKPLEKNCVICEAHFDERFIVRTYKHVINGETVEIPRDRPCLTPDAIPTVFPNVPSYLTKKLPPKRKTAASNGGVPRKRRKDDSVCDVTEVGEICVTDGGVDSECSTAEATPHSAVEKWLESIRDEDLPSKYWCKHLVPNAPDVMAFSVCEVNGSSLCFQKLLLCTLSETRSLHCLRTGISDQSCEC
nr:LOW QUALITY PROTEIN: uncharacterized protein LOC119184107 [Rhipicephalus microplus]